MRKQLDYYKTPAFAVTVLLESIDLTGDIIDCCSGNGEISNILKDKGHNVTTNDIDNTKPADYHFNSANDWPRYYDFVITNPPFNKATEIVKMAHRYSNIGVAMLLRLSFLEPTLDREIFLNTIPPSKLIVLPRISFTMDGRTDSVTVAWMIWLHNTNKQEIRIARKAK